MAVLSISVLCVGHACYDLVFAVDHHPGPDEKARAQGFTNCGGGTAANAALTAARLLAEPLQDTQPGAVRGPEAERGHRRPGGKVLFAGYLGRDIYGDQHLGELHAAGVDTSLVVRGAAGTPISAIFVKPDGARSIVNYKGDTNGLTAADVDFAALRPRVVLFDGHQPALALAVAEWARTHNIPTVLDADTVNAGNVELLRRCTVVAASERFAHDLWGIETPEAGLAALGEVAPAAIVTLGERGLIWQRGSEAGSLPAFPVEVVDTTGAGDAFHGALAAGIAAGMEWWPLLRYASAAGALCCTKHGARLGIPHAAEVAALLAG